MRALLLAIVVAAVSACSSPDPIPQGKPGECARCHQPDFQSARNHPGKKPTTCAVCHTQTGWHPRKTPEHEWKLDGAHAKLDCFKCHVGNPPQYEHFPHTCFDCHEKDYDKARNHKGKKPTTCQDCHDTQSWKDRIKKSKD